ncbi:serine--tRNA ligase [Streptomyces broussonetiae]|uniref:serine--tRNA ligase n=1 Tax=Streptomyces broussonetiae TaxID=2686304 RepID=UPI0035D778E1
MHDVRDLIAAGPEAVRQLARRGHDLDLAALEDLRRRRTTAQQQAQALRTELKTRSKALGGHKGQAPSDTDREAVRTLRTRVQQAEEAERTAAGRLTEELLRIPNLPLDSVPEGRTEKEAVEIRRGGPEPAETPDPGRHHAEVGRRLGIFETERAVRLSGSRFHVSKGPGARLERALASFLLDLHTTRHGYTEYAVPYLVTRDTMTGTGQLPKFEEDLFATRVGERELFLIPTAEVPLTNLAAGRPLAADDLPLALTAHTPCFRSEAGSYGRDTRGVLRLHQFEKVELVRVCTPDTADEHLQLMIRHAETCLEQLGLSHRVVQLPAGDLGFSARITYDLEVWLPGSGAFREISSVSDCGTFQARRAGIHYRTRDGRRAPAVTLNGSALPIGRTVAALLEQGARPDGSVVLPDALVPYTGFREILPGGTTR